MTLPELSVANAARKTAAEVRAHAIAEISSDMSNISRILQRACLPEGRPLLRLPLVRLLSAQTGVSRRSAQCRVARMHELLGLAVPRTAVIDRLTVGWLIDSRSGGRRVLALADAHDKKDEEPWPGFPYTMPPGKKT